MKFGLKDKKRIFIVVAAVILMGFSLSFLIRVNFGTDPSSAMNLGIARKLGISFGNWNALLNVLLFIIVIRSDRSQIGWGTIANMFLVGYSTDFFTWLFDLMIPAEFFTNFVVRVIILIPALALFIFTVAVYLAVELGSAPYDATVYIIATKLKRVPFKLVRMSWDIAACIIGFLMGSTIGIVTIIIALALGPVISFVRERIEKYIQHA